MRKLIATLCFIITNFNLVNAQICDSINCSNIKNYVNARITQAYLVDLTKDKKNKTRPDDSTNYKKIESAFESNKIENPLKYETLAKVLNENNFSKTRELFLDRLNSANISIKQGTSNVQISEDILNQLLNKLDDTRRAKVNQFPELLTSLKTEINTFITNKLSTPKKESEVKSTVAENGEIVADKDKTPNKVQDNSSFFLLSNFNFFTLLAILLSLAVFVFLALRISNLNEAIDKKIDKIQENKSSSKQGSVFPQKVEMSQSDFEKLLSKSERFNELYIKFERLEKRALNTNTQMPLVSSIQSQNTSNVGFANSDTFYMTKPVDNYFPVSAKSHSPSDTVYKFVIGENKTLAEYEIHTQGAPIGEIIKRSETYLVPGCNEENNPTVNVNRIVTRITGQVQLEGDRWMIKRKATIRYE